MRYLHTMVRVKDLDSALWFFCDVLGMTEVKRRDHERGRFTLVFLSTGHPDDSALIELTHNWDQADPYTQGRNFGHLAYAVEDIYAVSQKILDEGLVLSRPPRDGRMAFVRSPDGISIELLQAGDPLPITEPWASMPSVGEW